MRSLTFTGSPYQIGYQLGLQGKSIFASYIKNSHHFSKLLPWRDSDCSNPLKKHLLLE